MSGKTVFLIGPGFIGSEIIHLLLQENYQITTLVRQESAAHAFRSRGVDTVLGSIDDVSLLEKHVSASDIVIHTASADHMRSVEGVIAGIEKRASTGRQTIYIHTSGAGVLGDDSAGNFNTNDIFDDEHPEKLDALPDTAPHRNVDLFLLRKKEELGSSTKLAIMLPPLIYGVGSQTKRLSIQIPTLVRFAIKHGHPGQVGNGSPIWSQIHVKDLARGYLTILHWLERSSSEEVSKNPYWFCENGQELSWNEIVTAIGQALHQAGRVQNASPQTISKEDYDDLFSEHTDEVLGSNSRSRAHRLRKLGWSPREKQTLASLKDDEINLLLEETTPFQG